MSSQPRAAHRIQFGPFEYEATSRALTKYGTPVRLQGKPLRILSLLLDRTGQVVSREELQKHLWQDSIFVDFEQGLNSAINKMRQALGDSADQPRYIETLPGKGYRFIAPVQPVVGKVARDIAATGPIPVVKEAPQPRRLLPRFGAVATVAATIAIGAVILSQKPDDPRPVSRWTVTLSETRPESGLGVAISRDGTRLAYAEHSGPSSRIWVRMLNQTEGGAIPGTEGGLRPVFSPDGQWLAYVGGTRGALRKVSIAGGGPVTLCQGALYNGASWGDDDRIVFTGSKGLMRVSASGGPCELLTTADSTIGEGHRWPQMLPDRQVLLYTSGTVLEFENTAKIVALNLKTGVSRTVVNGAVVGRYLPTGYLAFVRRGVLFAVPFDLDRLMVTGSERRLVDGLDYRSSGGFADYAFSDSGLLIYAAAPISVSSQLVWLERSGATRTSLAPAREYRGIRLAPDGESAAVDFAFRAQPGLAGIWVVELARGASIRLPVTGFNRHPVWTPDGKRIAFSSQSNAANNGIFWTASDGSGTPELLIATDEVALPSSWTPDGGTMLFSMGSPWEIWSLSVNGERKAKQLFETSGFSETQPVVSPDGRWIAYTSNEAGENRIYARPFSGPGGKAVLSPGPGEQPRWSDDGKHIFYREARKDQLMVVDIQSTAPFRAGQPSAVSPLSSVPWDVNPDGSRILAVQRSEDAHRAAQLHVVVNWLSELQPADR